MFKVSQFDPRVLSWWRTQRDKIDMNPPYQRRGRLWSKTDKAYLIDSILNDYDIPKVYIADFTFGESKLNNKKLSYAIIDGKQRLESILDFFDGKLVLDDEFVYRENPNLKLSGLGYPDLKKNYPEVADKYDNFHLSVVRVITDDENQINELFVRLNRSKPLTGAEIRNAMTGPVPNLLRVLSEHEILATCVKFSKIRGQDLNASAKVLLFEYEDELKETKKKNLDKFVREGKKNPQHLELASRRVLDTFDRMAEAFLPSDNLLTSAGIFPVYYWFVRNIDTDKDQHVREFLLSFEQMRQANRNVLDEDKKNQELLEFDQMNRSTNDQKSHRRRYEILDRFFKKHINDVIKQLKFEKGKRIGRTKG
jgi:hypothetical protein